MNRKLVAAIAGVAFLAGGGLGVAVKPTPIKSPGSCISALDSVDVITQSSYDDATVIAAKFNYEIMAELCREYK